MEQNIFKDSLNDSLFWRIAAHCPPSNRGSGPILSQPDALANLEDRLLEALAPTKHDLELSAFDLMLAAQYEEAYNLLLQSDPSDAPALKAQLSKLHFISQPMDSFQNALATPRPLRTLPRLQDVSLSRNARCLRDGAMLADDAAFVPVFGFQTRGAGEGRDA
ncbi:hypothetical protein XPA_005766 [Xanthoria parietina]